MTTNPIMRVIARVNMPLMVVFAVYVQVHGEIGPGGGFQAGVIFAAAFILYGMVFGGAEMRRVFPRWISDAGSVLGVLIYAGTGVYSMLMGYPFLDHVAIWPSNPGGAEPWGMVSVEWGVGITVACVMMTIFNEITEGTDDPPPGADTEMVPALHQNKTELG
jgi:multicomponent Na+:H+ antiporter subunit B